MKNNRLFTALWAVLMAVTLSFAGIGCLVTGFDIPNANLMVMFLVCLGSSLVWLVLCQYRFVPLIVLGAAGLLWLLFLTPQADGEKVRGAHLLLNSVEVLINHISRMFNQGYNWGYIQWSKELPTETAQGALGLIACCVSLAVIRPILRQKRVSFGVFFAFLPLMTCMVLTDTVPDNIYLMLMVGGILLLALTNTLRRENAMQANRLTALLLVPIMLATIGLFWAVPREAYSPNQEAFAQIEQWLQGNPLWQQLMGIAPPWMAGDSGADEISLDDLGGKSDSNATALWVTATRSGYFYLRGRAYDSYDGKQWTASQQSSGPDRGWGKELWRGAMVTIRTEGKLNYLYFLGESGPPEGYTFDRGMLPNDNQSSAYTFQWIKRGQGGTIGSGVRQQCLTLPQGVEQVARMQLMERLNGAMVLSQREVVAAIRKLVNECAQYDLVPSRMPADEQDFAMWFLQEAERGYCVHFATTAAVLLRAAGIPARYVTGYVTQVKAGEETAVPQSRAHAWVEYFDQELGWTILEATPGFEQPGELPTEPPTEPTEETTEPTKPTIPTSNPTEHTTTQTLPTQTQMQPTDPMRPQPGVQEANRIGGEIAAVLLWILVGCAAIWGQYRLRIRIRKWYMTRGQANQQALERWRSVRIRSRIFGQKPPLQLQELAEKAKFSQHTLTEEELHAFDLHMALLADRLQKKPWLIKWLLRLFWAIE